MSFARFDDRAGAARVRALWLLVAAVALVWAIGVLMTGGFVLKGPFFRLSSRDATRPFVVALFAAGTYLLWYRRHLASDLSRIVAIRRVIPGWMSWPAAAAGALALGTVFIGVQWGSFLAGGPDASGYVSQAELWLHGDLIRPRPAWVDGAPWPIAWPTTPIGYLPGPDPRTMVPSYSPGLPMMMAVFQGFGGRHAVYYVMPLLGGLGVWVTYLLGTRLGGRTVGALSALLLFASPAYLHMLVLPMSDVPAAAVWTLALYFAMRHGMGYAFATGVATGLAILIRPNIVPLAAVVAVVLLPASLDTAIDYMRTMGYSVYLVIDYGEMNAFRETFAGTRTASDLSPATRMDLKEPLVYALGGTEPPPIP